MYWLCQLHAPLRGERRQPRALSRLGSCRPPHTGPLPRRRRSRPGEHRAYLTSQATPRRSRSSCRTAQRRACEFPLASSRTSTRLPSAETLPPAALTSGCATTAARSARTTLPPVSGSSTRQRSVDSAPTRRRALPNLAYPVGADPCRLPTAGGALRRARSQPHLCVLAFDPTRACPLTFRFPQGPTRRSSRRTSRFSRGRSSQSMRTTLPLCGSKTCPPSTRGVLSPFRTSATNSQTDSLGAVLSKVLWTREIARDMPTVSYDEVMSSEQGVYEWLKRIVRLAPPAVSPPSRTDLAWPQRTPMASRSALAFRAPLKPPRRSSVASPSSARRTTAGSGTLRQTWSTATSRTRRCASRLTPTRPTSPTCVVLSLSVCDARCAPRLTSPLASCAQPCGLQLFHLLSPSTTHTGGHNLLVDGFRAASVLREAHPAAYDLLSSVPIPSHASGSGSASLPSGVHLRPLRRFPVLNHDDKGELVMVRWNGDDRAVVGGEAFEGARMDEWYEALRTWEGILRSEEAQLWSQMEVGTAVSACFFPRCELFHAAARPSVLTNPSSPPSRSL